MSWCDDMPPFLSLFCETLLKPAPYPSLFEGIMKNKSLLLLVFASLSYVCETNAASLHALILCDTHADDIENGVSADYRHIKKELKRICKLTGLKEKMSTIHGDGVDSNFLKKMRKMHVEPDDVIIFYWSGHGKNLGDPLAA